MSLQQKYISDLYSTLVHGIRAKLKRPSLTLLWCKSNSQSVELKKTEQRRRDPSN